MRIKTGAIALGILMGCAGVFGGMAYKNHTTEAAVAVWDEKNIAEAIKTVLNTTNILTEEQKKIALELLNMKSLDAESLIGIFQRNTHRQETIWNEEGSYSGVLAAKKSIPAEWDDAFGNIDLILDGSISPQDAGKITASTIRILDRTNKDAANAAKAQQDKSRESDAHIQTLLEQSQKAEGEMQVQQTGNAINAEVKNAISDGNALLSHMLINQVTAAEAANARMAQDEAGTAASINGMSGFASQMNGH